MSRQAASTIVDIKQVKKTSSPVRTFDRQPLIPLEAHVSFPIPKQCIPDTLDFKLRHSFFTVYEHCKAKQYRITPAVRVFTDGKSALWQVLATTNTNPSTSHTMSDVARDVDVNNAIKTVNIVGAYDVPTPSEMIGTAELTLQVTQLVGNDIDRLWNRAQAALLKRIDKSLSENELVLATLSKPKLSRVKQDKRQHLQAQVRVLARVHNPRFVQL